MDLFENVVSYFDEDLSSVFKNMDISIQTRITEIRLRRNKPIVLSIKNTSYFLDYNGDIYDYINHSTVVCDSDTFDNVFMKMCDYSIYSNMENLKNGFITLPNGARVGVASTAVFDGNGLISVKDISSLNIRIPRMVRGCADEILNFLYINSFPSIVVAGAPNSGKTTVLREVARELSSGFNNSYRKVVVVDERNEICAKYNDSFAMDTGVNLDVLTGFKKADGIEIATRSMSPELIVCDEISTDKELDSIKYAFSSGVKFALSIHAGAKMDLYNRSILVELLKTGEFKYIIWLDGYSYKSEIIDGIDVLNEINRCDNNCFFNNNNRNPFVKSFEK